MNAEEYYRKKDYPVLDKFDKKAPKFDYYDFIDFAESYHKAKLNTLTIPCVVGQSEQLPNICSGCGQDRNNPKGIMCANSQCPTSKNVR